MSKMRRRGTKNINLGFIPEGGHADEFDPFCFMTQKGANLSELFVFKSRVEFVGNLFVFDVITLILKNF